MSFLGKQEPACQHQSHCYPVGGHTQGAANGSCWQQQTRDVCNAWQICRSCSCSFLGQQEILAASTKINVTKWEDIRKVLLADPCAKPLQIGDSQAHK